MRSLSNCGKSPSNLRMTCSPKSSGRTNRNAPLPDFPTGDRYPPMMYAFMALVSKDFALLNEALHALQCFTLHAQFNKCLAFQVQ